VGDALPDARGGLGVGGDRIVLRLEHADRHEDSGLLSVRVAKGISGRVVRDAPTSEFDAESLLGTITGLNTT